MTEVVEQLRTALADRYVLERELGRGGMATVYLAQDLKHDRPVALKLLAPELAHALGPERCGRLEEAARVLNEPPTIESPSFQPRPSDILWFLERGRVAERLGDRARALEAYRYVAAAWRHPDPELAPYAAEARAGLGRLTAEPGQ